MLQMSQTHSGFYRIPRPNCNYFINNDGVVINELTGKAIKPFTTPRGYVCINIRAGFPKRYECYRLHRLVALLFVEKPVRHQDKLFSELQVNHIDGKKKNNNHLNLEWVTDKENREHAQKNSLYGTEKIVLAKNINSNEVKEFVSISECARWVCMSTSRLSVHLHSVCAGIIEKDGYIFKFKDESEWPVRIRYDRDTTTLHYVADVIAENIDTGEKLLCKSLLHAICLTGLTRNKVMNDRARFGNDKPVKGWLFYKFKPNR